MRDNNKTFTCICCSFLLSVFVTVLGILIPLRIGYATNRSVSRAVDEVGYTDMVYEELLFKCESVAIPNALTKEVFDDVFSKKVLERDCRNYLEAQLNGKTIDVNTDSSREKLIENINAYVKKNNLKVDGDQDKIINEFADKIMKLYIKALQVPYAGRLGNIFRNISGYFRLICPVMVLFSAAVIYALFILNRRKKNRAFRYMAYSFMAGAFSVLAIPIACYCTDVHRRLQIYPEYVYKFIVRHIENSLEIMIVAGCILAVLALSMIVVSCCIKHKLKQRGYRRK